MDENCLGMIRLTNQIRLKGTYDKSTSMMKHFCNSALFELKLLYFEKFQEKLLLLTFLIMGAIYFHFE